MIAQIMIALLGLAAVWLSQDSREGRRRYACIAGMASQPFWLWATWESGQWGMFALSCCYTVAWARGIRANWLSNPTAHSQAG